MIQDDPALWETFDSEQPALDRVQALKAAGGDPKLIQQDWPVPDRTLPTDRQVRALWDFMHALLVEIRQLGYANKPERVAELADVLHNLPREVFDAESWDWNAFEMALREYAKKASGELTGMRLARMLREIRENP